MVFEYPDRESRETRAIDARLIVIKDSEGNSYRIKENKFGGLEIMADDGQLAIEPSVSNLIVIKTLN